MNSYDHPRSDDRGYAGYDPYGSYDDAYSGYQDSYSQQPDPAAGYAADPYARSGPDPYAVDSYAEPAPRSTARATASVSVASARARVPAGRATVGSAAVGAAAVGSPVGEEDGPRPRYDWGSGRAAAGRASVPVSPAAGGAAGRASVRPGGGEPPRPAGGGAGARPPRRKKKRRWIRNTLLSFLAVLVIAAGGGMVALSYYVESVPLPEELDLPEVSTILYADGSEMAVLQEVNREIIDTTVPELEHVRNAVVAAEDNKFWDHSGVDFQGIARAFINNITGGERQGASTIDQQYTRHAAELTEDSYSRKLQEAAMAYKMNQEYSKDEILDFYLNTIYFGRGAHGIEAAAKAYFGKPAVELSVGEAALLAGVIRVPDDGSGLSPYDPLNNPDDQSVALARWNYVLDQMVGMGTLDPTARAELVELPEVIDPKGVRSWHEGPQGNIVRQVRYELERNFGITDLTTGGYRITTTIDPEIQQAALDAARRKNKASYWETVSKDVDAAIVAIDPATGAVRAYYGGEDGTGFDLAGPNYTPDLGWHGGRAPGSTFKIYTLVAALREGVSLKSHWRTSNYQPDWAAQQIHNAGRVATSCEGVPPDYCTLYWSTQYSYNVPFAYFSEAVPGNRGPALIVQAAMDAGIRMMKDTREGIWHDLTEIESADEVAPEYFYHPVAYGQYPVTVLDHASGVATFAARGVYHEPHFVERVEQKVNGEWVEINGSRVAGEQRIDTPIMDAITGVLSTIPALNWAELANGRPAAAKTGTWEHPDGGNMDAWMVGYTPQLAAAVWVGDDKGKPIYNADGSNIGSHQLPSWIWKKFMDDAHAVKGYEIQQFPPAPDVGNPNHPYANGVLPEPEDDDDPLCRLPIIQCDSDDDDDDDRRGPGGPGDQGGRGGGADSDPGVIDPGDPGDVGDPGWGDDDSGRLLPWPPWGD